MGARFMEDVLLEFDVVVADAHAPADARSGAGVHQVRASDGTSAFLKLTPAELGPEARRGPIARAGVLIPPSPLGPGAHTRAPS